MNRVNTASPPARDSRHRRFRIAVLAASVVAAVVGSVLLAMRDSGEKATTLGVTATLRVPGHPGAVVAGPDALWVALAATRRNRPATGRSSASTSPPGQWRRPCTWVGRFLTWRTSGTGSLPRSSTSAPGSASWQFSTGAAASCWCAAGSTGRSTRSSSAATSCGRSRHDPGRCCGSTRGRSRRPRLRFDSLPAAHWRWPPAAGYLWVTAADTGEVLRIDPATHAIKRVHVGGFPIGIVVTGGSVWFADHEGGKVVRLDPRSLRPVGEPIRVGTKPSWLVVAGGSLFVTDQDDGTVTRIDVQSGNKVGLPIRISRPARDAPAPSVAPAGRSVWVSSFASNTLTRINSTAGRDDRGGKVTVRISDMNDTAGRATASQTEA